MLQGSSIVAIAIGYVSLLFMIAWIGDRTIRLRRSPKGRPAVYALSLAVYCTSWTFFGSVGLATSTGYDFIPVYLGPILLFTLGWPLILHIVRLAKSQNITSVADFMAARYGKSQAVAAVVTLVAIAGTLPYIALQLKAIAVSIETLLGGTPLVSIEVPRVGFADTAFAITLTLATFAVLFGTRHIEATEHQDGLMLAVAAESLVKLAAFIAVGLSVIFYTFDGPADLLAQAAANPVIEKTFGQGLNGGTWLTVMLLSVVCVLLLPRQFHVAVVENNSETEVRHAAWMFPLYLVLINLFVVPIAAAGLLTLPNGLFDPDFFVLTLPMQSGSHVITIISYIGGLSSATAMVIVESVALAIMISNGFVLPLLLRYRLADQMAPSDMTPLLLAIRRIAIFAILILGYIVYRILGNSHGLAAIGLISFAAIAQLAPAFFLGLVWRQGTARGAIAGIITGFGVWAYTLLLPWYEKAGWIPASIVTDGPFGLSFLKPQALLYLQFDPLTHGVLWSLSTNVIAFIFVSLLRTPEPVERMQASVFIPESESRAAPSPAFRLWRSSITIGDLQSTVARYLGTERAQRSFQEYASSRNVPLTAHAEADVQTIRFTEHLLASAIGAASSRLVLSLLLRRGNVGNQAALKLLDDASEALQYNRDLLQSALDQVRHGLSVFDKEMRLICWNRQFREMLNLPPELGRVGVPLDKILRMCAERGDYGPGDPEALAAERLLKLAVTKERFQEAAGGGNRIMEVRTSAMPQGGIVTTYSDITDRVVAADALARANETLERRVRERTAELLQVNAALAVAKSQAEEASLDKTRFLAAASHDILQPLNAARLYATSLTERPLPSDDAQMVRNVDASLSAVEEIFSALIDISRMDTGRLEPEITEFAIAPVVEQLTVEFAPIAKAKGLDLRVVPTSLWVRSDRRLFRRLLQNLISNAIKYTPSGRVLVGVRRHQGNVTLCVIDTGPGIAADKQKEIFKEFHRLDDTPSNVRGLGLGLSIVERIGRVLGHPIYLDSAPGHGSRFAFSAPRAEPREGAATVPQAVIPGSLAGITALCIDNEPAVLSGMETLLTGWGCRVLRAESRATALQVLAAAAERPDVILADFHLDDDTGIAIVEALRTGAGIEIPAVIITADHSPELQRDARRLGLGLLRKPLKAAALRAILAQFVMRRSAAAE